MYVLAAIALLGGTLNAAYPEVITRLNARFLKLVFMPQWYIDSVGSASSVRAAGFVGVVLGIVLLIVALLFPELN